MKTGSILLVLFIFILACETPFEYHPNQIILEEHERNLTEKNVSRILEKEPTDTICFALMGDTQRFYDQLEDFSASIQNQEDVEFIIHSGDISDFGWAKEFKWVNRIMATIHLPYITAVGNHDLIANGRAVYSQMYGKSNYTFDYGFVRFVLFDSNSREHGFQGKIPDLEWIAKQIDLSQAPHIQQIVAISHIPPFDADFDPELEEAYAKLGKTHPKFNLSLHGHQHNRSTQAPYGEEITIHVEASVKKRTYSKIKVWKDGFSIEKITY